MIQLDNRVGSRELKRVMPKQLIQLTRLEYADAAFLGHGATGDELIGIERKVIRDLINSMTSGRLSGHQLPGLLNSYNHVYIIVEGLWRIGRASGLIEVPRARGRWITLTLGTRTFTGREILSYCNTLTICTGVHVIHTATMHETGQHIAALHRWWNKPWEKHKSHMVAKQPETVSLTKHTLLRRVAAQIPGVGWERARDIDAAFPTVAALIDAKPEQLTQIPGIGEKMAQRIHSALHGGGD